MTSVERAELAELRHDLMGRFDLLDGRLRGIEQKVAIQQALDDRLSEIEAETRGTRRWLVSLVLSGGVAVGGLLLRSFGA